MHYDRRRNINLLPIVYDFRPELRNRLTLGGLTCPRNPWVFGEQVSHLFSRYSCWHNRLSKLQSFLSIDLRSRDNAPLPLIFFV